MYKEEQSQRILHLIHDVPVTLSFFCSSNNAPRRSGSGWAFIDNAPLPPVASSNETGTPSSASNGRTVLLGGHLGNTEPKRDVHFSFYRSPML